MVFHNKLWWRLQSLFKYILKLHFDRPVMISAATKFDVLIEWSHDPIYRILD